MKRVKGYLRGDYCCFNYCDFVRFNHLVSSSHSTGHYYCYQREIDWNSVVESYIDF